MRIYNFHHPINASMYYNRAIICFDKCFAIPDGSYLFYATLELRVCIERFLFEYLVIINTKDEKIEKYIKEYRIKNLHNAIIEAEPEFYKKLEFTNFYLATMEAGFQMDIPDIKRLDSYYGKLGNYLHNFKKPSETVQNEEWWNSFIQLIEETRDYLFKFFKVPRAFFEMNEKGFELYRAYKEGIIPKQEIGKRILSDFK